MYYYLLILLGLFSVFISSFRSSPSSSSPFICLTFPISVLFFCLLFFSLESASSIHCYSINPFIVSPFSFVCVLVRLVFPLFHSERATLIDAVDIRQSNGEVWLKVIKCLGSEPNIAKCKLEEADIANTLDKCEHYDDIGVKCGGKHNTRLLIECLNTNKNNKESFMRNILKLQLFKDFVDIRLSRFVRGPVNNDYE